MAFGSRTVAQRDVQFNVNLGQFRAELGEAQGIYARSTGQMSTAALELSVREERLARAIKQHGASSIQARSATVALRHETEKLSVASGISRDKILAEERALGRFTRGALEGSGALKGFGRALAFSSGAFLGGAGLVYALETTVKAAEEMQIAQGQLEVALKDSNISWAKNRDFIQASLDTQVKLTAFTNGELTTSLAGFVRRFGDVNEALKANAIAADVARAKNISLSDAQSLILRASFGNPRSLRVLGIELTKTTANMDALKATTQHASAEQIAAAKAADLQANELSALDRVNAKYHGNAAKYLTTTTGKQALFRAELKRSEEIIGTALLPTIDHLVGRMARYLDKLNRTGKLEKDVHRYTHDVGVAFHDAGVAIGDVKGILEGLAPLFGGVKNEVKLLTAALLLFKLNGVAAFKTGAAEIETASVPLIAAESASVAGASGVVARVAAYTAAGAAGAAAGKGGPFGRGGGGKLGGGGFILPGLSSDSHPGGDPVKDGTILTQNGKKFVVHADSNGRIISIAPYTPTRNTSGHSNDPVSDAGGGVSTSFRRGGKRPPPPPGTILGLTNAQQTALLVAQGTSGTADDRRALEAQLAIYNRLLGQKGLNAAQRNDLLAGRNAVLSQIGSIDSENASLRSEAAQKASEAARRRAAARNKKLLALTKIPAILVAREARAETAGAPTSVILKLLTQEKAALNRQGAELRRDGAPARFDALIAKRGEAVQKHIKAVLANARGKRIAALEQAPVGLQIAVETAIAHNASEDKLLVLYRKERAAIEKQVVELRKIHAGKDAILRARTSEAAIQKHINQITKNKRFDLATNEREFLSEFNNLVGNDASNLRPGVTVHQHFNAPPTNDGHREARVAHIAMQSAYDQ